MTLYGYNDLRRYRIWLPKKLKFFCVKLNGSPKRWDLHIHHVEFFGGCFNDLGNFAVVNVTDHRKQMMLYLVIQPTNKPT